MRAPGTYLIPVHHPKSLFANQTYAFSMLSDWAKAVRIQRDGATRVPPPIEEWQWKPTLVDVRNYFGRMARLGSRTQTFHIDPGPWSVDFEATLDGRPVCVGFWSADRPMAAYRRGLCVPVLCQGGGDYWTPAEWREVFAILKDFFTDPARGKIGHNLVGYDTGYIDLDGNHWNQRALIKTAWDFDVVGVVGDTMAAHYTAYSELRQNLAFLASMVTDLGPFKLEVWEDDNDGDDDPNAGKPDWVKILERPDIKTRSYNLFDNFAQAMGWNVLVEVMA